MQSRRAVIIFLLGVCMVIWSLCLYQVMIMPKYPDEEVSVSPTIDYSSSNTSASSAPSVSTMRRSSFAVSSSPMAPQIEMQSPSAPLSTGNMRLATTSSARVTVVNSGGYGGTNYGQASYGTSSSTSRGIKYTNSSMYIPPAVHGFITSASSVAGGRSAEETYAGIQQRTGAPNAKKDMPLPPGLCDECHWEFIGGQWVCTVCGHNALDGCDCDEHLGYCRCPIDDGWPVWLFMSVLAISYVLMRKPSRRRYHSWLDAGVIEA